MHQLPAKTRSLRTDRRASSRLKMASRRTVEIKTKSKIMVELTSSTALPSREAANFLKWVVGEAAEVAAKCVNEPSKRTRTLLASNRARTSDIRTMVDVVGADEVVATTTGVAEAVAAVEVAMAARMKTVNIKINSTEGTTGAVDKAAATTKEVEEAEATTRVAGDTTTTTTIKAVAIITTAGTTRIVAVGTTGDAGTTKASSSVRLVIHLRMQSANSNNGKNSNRCDCSFLAAFVAKHPQRQNEPAACEVH